MKKRSQKKKERHKTLFNFENEQQQNVKKKMMSKTKCGKNLFEIHRNLSMRELEMSRTRVIRKKGHFLLGHNSCSEMTP